MSMPCSAVKTATVALPIRSAVCGISRSVCCAPGLFSIIAESGGAATLDPALRCRLRHVVIARPSAIFRASSAASFFFRSAISLLLERCSDKNPERHPTMTCASGALSCT